MLIVMNDRQLQRFSVIPNVLHWYLSCIVRREFFGHDNRGKPSSYRIDDKIKAQA